MARHPVPVSKQPPMDDFAYALERAIRDHGKNQLSEAVLADFERDLVSRRSSYVETSRNGSAEHPIL
jgi:hypothetical protein